MNDTLFPSFMPAPRIRVRRGFAATGALRSSAFICAICGHPRLSAAICSICSICAICAICGYLADAWFDACTQTDSAVQHFMPGIRLARRGETRHCQGTLLADWTMVGPDGQERGTGTNVFQVGPQRTIESVTGILNTRS